VVASVVVVVAVLGAACGKYPGTPAGQGFDARPVVARRAPAQSPAAQPAAAPTQGTTARGSSIVGDDGANGPRGKVITGGTSTVDLSKMFSGKGAKPGSGAKGSSTTSGSKTSGSKTGGSKTGGSRSGSKGSLSGGDGANPGKPSVSGGPSNSTPAGASNMAELISRETTKGARYNSTVLPKGFPLRICPVQGKYSYSDTYGAPRYAGGYHPHAGNDIFAAMGTPIVAPFDGYVSRVPNTLGGNAVEVRGSQGYVYMAHLVAYGITDRHVRAGTVVGFVGNTGDAQATSPHDHFEWHPFTVAPYDRVIAGTNGAVDPFPYLQVVCPPG
jgi:murein DD-endopeptidase MepM/ murein hydrolase activator NlpD